MLPHDNQPDPLNQRLAARSNAMPSGGLRDRILNGVQKELARPKPKTFWQTTGCTAAAAVLWINLSMSAANETDMLPTVGDPICQMLTHRERAMETLGNEFGNALPTPSLESRK